MAGRQFLKINGIEGESSEAILKDADGIETRNGIMQSVEPVLETETGSSEPSSTIELGEGGYGLSASDDYHDDTSDVGAPASAQHGGFNMGIQFEPVTESSTIEIVGASADAFEFSSFETRDGGDTLDPVAQAGTVPFGWQAGGIESESQSTISEGEDTDFTIGLNYQVAADPVEDFLF